MYYCPQKYSKVTYKVQGLMGNKPDKNLTQYNYRVILLTGQSQGLGLKATSKILAPK